MRLRLLSLVCFILLTTLCNSAIAESNHHGEKVTVGSVNLLDNEYQIFRLGKLIPGHESAFQVTAQAELSDLSAFLWLESEDGKRASAPSRGMLEDGALHFHVKPSPHILPSKLVLRIRENTKDQRATLELGEEAIGKHSDSHGHSHSH